METALSVACAAALTAGPALAIAGEEDEAEGAAEVASEKPAAAAPDGKAHGAKGHDAKGDDARIDDTKAHDGKGHDGKAREAKAQGKPDERKATAKKGKKARRGKAADAKTAKAQVKEPGKGKKAKKSAARGAKKKAAKKPAAASSRGSDGKAPSPPGERLDPGLGARVASLAARFPGKTVAIVPPNPEPGEGSLHRSGLALDLAIAGVSTAELAAACRALADTGCGEYPAAGFVHVDVRPAGSGSRAWIDLATPGEPPRYSAVKP